MTHFLVTVTISPILKTREKIQVTIDFILKCDGLASFFQFVADPDGETQQAQHEIQVMAESIANQWALQFFSAEHALDRSAYESLARLLARIRSSTCKVVGVNTRGILPLTDPIPPPRPAPPLALPAPPPSPAPTMSETLISQVMESVKTVSELKRVIQKDYPDLWDDPDFRGRLEDTFYLLINGHLGNKEGI